MKCLLLYLAFICFLVNSTYSQSVDHLSQRNKKEAEEDVFAIQTFLLGRSYYGLKLGIKYFPKKRIGTGVVFVYTQKKVSDTFGYIIKEPILQYFEMGWINQYNFIETNRIRCSGRLLNGFVQVRLGDNAYKEIKHKNRPKEIASDYYYTFHPGMGFSYNLTPKEKNGSLWVTLEGNYRWYFGRSKFATTGQFSGYATAIGLTIVGFDDP